jgi:hypothetical protein
MGVHGLSGALTNRTRLPARVTPILDMHAIRASDLL